MFVACFVYLIIQKEAITAVLDYNGEVIGTGGLAPRHSRLRLREINDEIIKGIEIAQNVTGREIISEHQISRRCPGGKPELVGLTFGKSQIFHVINYFSAVSSGWIDEYLVIIINSGYLQLKNYFLLFVYK